MYCSKVILALICMMALAFQSCQKNQDSAAEDPSSLGDLKTQVFSYDNVQSTNETFGTVKLFTDGLASTYGTKNVTTGLLTILPNSEAHPPHKHEEEEYLMITKGSGTWSINGKEFQAKTGDLLYAAPWDIHGIFNSDTINMEFFFVKWNNKGVALPLEK